MEPLSGLPKYLSRDRALHYLGDLGEDYALIQNPGYVHPPYDIIPLAPRRKQLNKGARAFLIDMDGTTTTTEDLCLNALENMVRRTTGWNAAQWRGLDPVRDFPNIIGTSTTQNVEYLMGAYGHGIDARLFLAAFLEAVAWTLGKSSSAARKAEAQAHLAAMGMLQVMEDSRFSLLRFTAFSQTPEMQSALKTLVDKYLTQFPLHSRTDRVRAGVEIYYQRLYHFFMLIANQQGAVVSREVHGDDSLHPIRPLPGLGALHAIAKGWLGSDAAKLYEHLHSCLPEQRKLTKAGEERLARLGAYFERRPAAVALVTSSTRYEAEVVLREVFKGLVDELETWEVPGWRKRQIEEGFSDSMRFYDTVVTATDCHEIRLKPHRDLYSVALHQLGLNQEEFVQVAGFEDTEAGVISMRAAGVGVSCAVPFAGTRGHDFSAASHVAFGGFPEVLLTHGLFVPVESL